MFFFAESHSRQSGGTLCDEDEEQVNESNKAYSNFLKMNKAACMTLVTVDSKSRSMGYR